MRDFLLLHGIVTLESAAGLQTRTLTISTVMQ